VIGGREGAASDVSQHQPLHAIAFHDDAQHVAISGNTFSYINESAIHFSGKENSFIAISGNVFSEIVNEPKDLVAHAGVFFAEHASRLAITGNTFAMSKGNRSGSLYAIRAPKKIARAQIQANILSDDIADVIPRSDHTDSTIQSH
jgi:hypothetical protein